MEREKLLKAINSNDIKFIQAYISKGLTIDFKDEFGYSPLLNAIIEDKSEIAEIFIKNTNDINQKGKKGQTALHYTASLNNIVLTMLLIENDAEIDVRDSFGNTPLWVAVFNVKGKKERYPIVELLLKNNADINSKNNYNRSPIDFANQVNDIELIKLLQSFG